MVLYADESRVTIFIPTHILSSKTTWLTTYSPVYFMSADISNTLCLKLDPSFSLLFKSHPPSFLTIRNYGSIYLVVQVGYLKAIFDFHLIPRVPHLSISFNFSCALKSNHASAPWHATFLYSFASWSLYCKFTLCTVEDMSFTKYRFDHFPA